MAKLTEKTLKDHIERIFTDEWYGLSQGSQQLVSGISFVFMYYAVMSYIKRYSSRRYNGNEFDFTLGRFGINVFFKGRRVCRMGVKADFDGSDGKKANYNIYDVTPSAKKNTYLMVELEKMLEAINNGVPEKLVVDVFNGTF